MDNNLHELQLWGGIECTINRIGDQYFDQLKYAGHYDRPSDIDRFAELGLKFLRYPMLWEHHQLNKHGEIYFSRSEQRIESLRQKGFEPILGLVHHGSGPAFTNLLDENFAEELACYAGKVAEKFPWINYYTPVNEPLTTARFSGLYGLWYPHQQNDISFARMLLNQLKATVLSMAAIRKINPAAKLVQTEDLGKTYSTDYLSFQASFENERRWLTYDLLCGKLKKGDLMWDYFLRLGIPEADLEFFQHNACPPDIAGMNYYITSERFLDHDLEKYPLHTHGGNELQEYADVEAIRADHKKPWGLELLLKEAWERYNLPLAITECHLNCSREEQMRWLKETWDVANECRSAGIDIRAVTSWALLGSFGWDKLLTSPDMNYEPGVFDVRQGEPRPTALASLIKDIINKNSVHPLALQAGWWQRIKNKELKFAYREGASPILITGKTGTLGKAFARICHTRGLNYVLTSREELDITDAESIENAINEFKPWAIINATGYVRVDDAEDDQEKCFHVNCTGAVLLAEAAAKHQLHYVNFSSDLVFDGSKEEPYVETDIPNPLNVYGRSKYKAEKEISAICRNALLIRTSAFFGPWDKHNFIHAVIDTLERGEEFEAADDIFISPTYVPHLVNTTLDLLIDNISGIRHLTNNGFVSWADLAMMTATRFGLNENLVIPVSSETISWRASRPAFTVLGTSYVQLMPGLEAALERYVTDRREHIHYMEDTALKI